MKGKQKGKISKRKRKGKEKEEIRGKEKRKKRKVRGMILCTELPLHYKVSRIPNCKADLF